MKLTKEQKLEIYRDYLDNFTLHPIKTIVEGVIASTPTVFFVASTSSSGKYHPQATNGYMGLVKHSIAVMLTAQDMMRNDTLMSSLGLAKLSPLDKEIILAACLLHDNGKYGYEDEIDLEFRLRTNQNHPRWVAEIAKKAGLYESLKEKDNVILLKILKLIETHMGQWNEVRNGEDLPTPSTPEQVFVHMSDYIASRKTLDTVSELSLPDNASPELIQWFEIQSNLKY